MNCPVCGEVLEPEVYANGFHPVVNFICPECGYETQLANEISMLKYYINLYEDASISGCNDEEQQAEYDLLAKWLKELLTIKEGNK